MAKDVITRFKLETTQYDSALRTASKELSDYAKTASNAGKDFDKFTKSNAEAARAFGNIATSATNSKEKVKELVGAYNEMARAYELLSKEQQQSDWGKAMAESLTKLQQRIKDAKEELYGLGNAVEDVKSKSSGLFGEGGLTGMMAVAGGNLLSKGVTMLAGELTDAIGKSIELAKQGEGIRIAFDRLNRTDLLDQLKEATHGTVSELELMKQAVKFNDFNLNLDEMGTLLAFAQQKAKDTGQSVDYMVDSIVTGLGRQSLMILDNLGLSAAEIKERMKEGGDMTTAVASIIKDQMSEAGEYIETAADRAARAAADAANEMESFGKTAAPIAEEWSQTWKTLTIGAMNFANTLLGPVARSIRSIQNILNTNPEDRITGSKYNLFNGYTNQGPATKPTWGDIPVKTAPGGYVEVKDASGKVIRAGHFDNEDQRQKLLNSSRTSTRSGGGGRSNQPSYMEGSLSEQQALVSELTKKWHDAAGTVKDDYLVQLVAAESLLQKMKENDALDKWAAGYNIRKGGINVDMSVLSGSPSLDAWWNNRKNSTFTGLTKEGQKALENQQKKYQKQQQPEKKEDKSFVQVADQLNGGISNMVSSLEQMGIDIPEGFQSILGGISGVIGVLQAIMIIAESIEAMQSVGTFLGIFKNGGIVPHAANGYYVPGNNYSGDRTPILANAGELILNKAQQGNLASQLAEGGMMGNLRLEAVVTGENLRFVLNNNGKRTGRGEYVQTNRR